MPASTTSRSLRPWFRFRNSRTWLYTLRGALIAPKYFPSGHCTGRPMSTWAIETDQQAHRPRQAQNTSIVEFLSSLDTALTFCLPSTE
jgi:hypothetical protein